MIRRNSKEELGMNMLRTIRKGEEQSWVDRFFQAGPHEGEDDPEYPPTFPFPFKLKKRVQGGYLYIVYRNRVIGYGSIAEVSPRRDVTDVGRTDGRPVNPGDGAILAGPLRKMPFPLRCRGFTGVRYTRQNLHSLNSAAAEEEIGRLKLT
jgi:hypothetical protein